MTRDEAIKVLQINKGRLCTSVRMAVEVLMKEVAWKSEEIEPEFPWKSEEQPRRKFGERKAAFMNLNVGYCIEVPLRNSRNWTTWRSTASYLAKTYGCISSVRRKKDDRSTLVITRLV
jgi:hypothetical protein